MFKAHCIKGLNNVVKRNGVVSEATRDAVKPSKIFSRVTILNHNDASQQVNTHIISFRFVFF